MLSAGSVIADLWSRAQPQSEAESKKRLSIVAMVVIATVIERRIIAMVVCCWLFVVIAMVVCWLSLLAMITSNNSAQRLHDYYDCCSYRYNYCLVLVLSLSRYCCSYRYSEVPFKLCLLLLLLLLVLALL